MSIRVEAQERDRQRRQVRGAAAGDGGDGNVVEEWRRAVHNIGEQLAVQPISPTYAIGAASPGRGKI